MTSSYEKYIKGGEIVYPGKVDSIQVYPGKNRIKLSWLLLTDSKVTKARVFWNQGSDSVEIDIPRSDGIDTVEVMLNEMQEGSYTFEIVTYDAQGNASIPVSTLGRVYGPRYQSQLANRPVYAIKWQPGGKSWIEWGAASLSAIGTIVKYKNVSGASETITVSPEDDSTGLPGLNPSKMIKYQTMHVPDSMAIDSFYADLEKAPVNEIYIENSGFPFEHGVWDNNRWGYPKNWTINDAVKNQGGFGGFDGIGGGGYLAMEKWNNSQAAIINGKIYQTFTLPAGKYSLEADFSSEEATFTVYDKAYMVVAEGDSLPDIEKINSQALGYTIFEEPKIEFSLNQEKKISFGLVATFQQNGQNFRCHSIRLYKVE